MWALVPPPRDVYGIKAREDRGEHGKRAQAERASAVERVGVGRGGRRTLPWPWHRLVGGRGGLSLVRAGDARRPDVDPTLTRRHGDHDARLRRGECRARRVASALRAVHRRAPGVSPSARTFRGPPIGPASEAEENSAAATHSDVCRPATLIIGSDRWEARVRPRIAWAARRGEPWCARPDLDPACYLELGC